MFFCAQKRFFTIKKHITRILDAYCTVKTERDRKKVNFCQKLQTLKKITPSSGENNSRSDALLQTPFWVTSQKTTFCTFLAPMEVSKLRFGAYRQNFLGASGAPNMLKNGQKGLPRCRKAPINVQNILGVLRKSFPNFRKIVEISTFRQH